MRQQRYELAPYLFHRGADFRAYEYLGVHRSVDRFVFRVWAPGAAAAFAVGDFNSWSESLPMKRITPGGIWECEMRSDIFGQGSLYKFKFITDDGERYRADPFGAWFEREGQGASRFFESRYLWRDGGWFDYRASSKVPVSIYGVDLGAWCRRGDGSCRSFGEVAPLIASRAKADGHTHVALRSAFESAPYGDTGFEVTGFYAPSSKYGDPDDFRALVDYMHRAGVGVILDWSPGCFSTGDRGLAAYDGSPLYEDRIVRRGGDRHLARFDLARDGVRSFLISNACYWIDRYHIDGLRVCTPQGMPRTEGEERLYREIAAELEESFPCALLFKDGE
jgi:1,4-alpha-glucan branching enzyme